MHDRRDILHQTKSYTGISDIFGSAPFNNVLYQNPNKSKNKYSGEVLTESDKKPTSKNSLVFNETYVTCEKYHGLNNNLSYNSLVRSTSTIFCDLDDIAKRHSFHCLTEVNSNNNILKVINLPFRENGFKGKSNIIVQECSTQIHPKSFAKDSIEIIAKKVKKSFAQNNDLSSETFLNEKQQYYNIDVSNYLQKFWSYGKYRTEYDKPTPEKASKRKEHTKRIENPCPCQLFSYACPCADKKSLTELAKRSKNLTVADQITSTAQINFDGKKKIYNAGREDKFTNITFPEGIKIVKSLTEQIVQVAERKDMPTFTDIMHGNKNTPRKRRLNRKAHKVICPNCKERVEVFNSTTEEDDILKCDDSVIYRERSKELSPILNCSSILNRNRCQASKGADLCNHEPRCELVPVCQILPTENISVTRKIGKKHGSPPRVIRITKACRHHPPCTVVPSCQRTNVLRNNCEYIPPCLHQPRCMNLPLCVPFSKSINYDETCKHIDDDVETADYQYDRRCNYIQSSKQNFLENSVDRNFNTIARVQGTCGFKGGNRKSAQVIKQQSTLISTMCPARMSPTPCCSWRSKMSCQYECSESRLISSYLAKGSMSTDAIVLMRDVGCQFQNRICSPQDSMIRSKTSSGSFDPVDVKTRNFYTMVNTLRYEDKFTNPRSGLESLSTDSMMEIDSECPTHGHRSARKRYTGFNPSQRYVTACASFISHRQKDVSKLNVARYRDSTIPVKSRRSFIKKKHRKTHTANRRRSNASSIVVTCAKKIKM
ncbi:Uncharacterized protein OBRU01_06742 [Operophtera brumata]|uniref:Uncharacterized protein n=1 Tax=Operophtera brumata TaxID=104452 RepID=A0A0L7LJX2_OPEBR|nr:Uncharacterized protein OBRU01_06742 [Operophtera brumata]